MIYLVDSAGARITDQVQMFPGRRGAGRIFHNEVRLSGQVPQVCLLFGPTAAGGAYIPAFCDVVIMREGNASMYLGSPRMAEMVIGEKVTLEEMGGAKMHTSRLRLRPLPGRNRRGRDRPRPALPLLHAGQLARGAARRAAGRAGSAKPRSPRSSRRREGPVRRQGADRRRSSTPIRSCEVHARWAKELVVGYARLDGRVIGIVANQPKVKGGVLFVDSADKAARFIMTCNAFNVPLLFLADVPGFMIGTDVERQGIIRHGAKMISAVSEATVPKISVIVRKAYGAGLYAMAGPAFEPDCCIAFPQASIAVMGPEAAINAVFFNQIQEIEDEAERERFVKEKREEYAEDIDILHLASELVVDAVIEPDDAACRADSAVRARREQGPSLRGPAQPSHARLDPSTERCGRRMGPATRSRYPRASAGTSGCCCAASRSAYVGTSGGSRVPRGGCSSESWRSGGGRGGSSRCRRPRRAGAAAGGRSCPAARPVRTATSRATGSKCPRTGAGCRASTRRSRRRRSGWCPGSAGTSASRGWRSSRAPRPRARCSLRRRWQGSSASFLAAGSDARRGRRGSGRSEAAETGLR